MDKETKDFFKSIEENAYCDKNGKKITVEEWANLFEDEKYRFIERTDFEKGFISTVWTGANLNFFLDREPLIFETMVFMNDKEDQNNNDCMRYNTLEEAIDGHKEFVKKYVK